VRQRANGGTPDVEDFPLIAFVHIMKAAGSSVNRLLELCSPRGRNWCHHFYEDRHLFLQLALTNDWLSGHLGADSFHERLKELDRPVEYFSVVRDPALQIISHMNYSFERYNRPDYLELHTQEERERDFQIMSLDFGDVSAVIKFLTRHADIFLNIQSRYVLGEDYADLSDEEVDHRLAVFTYIGTTETLDRLYRAFGFVMLPPDTGLLRENVAQQHIPYALARNGELIDFLERCNAHDMRLWRQVKGASWPGENRRAYRPAFVGRTEATDETFDEFAYLQANPDVAEAVQGGFLLSGREHFESYGKSERRQQLCWIWETPIRSQKKWKFWR